MFDRPGALAEVPDGPRRVDWPPGAHGRLGGRRQGAIVVLRIGHVVQNYQTFLSSIDERGKEAQCSAVAIVVYRGGVDSWVKGSEPVLFVNLHSKGERGRKGRECKFQNKAHTTFGKRNM